MCSTCLGLDYDQTQTTLTEGVNMKKKANKSISMTIFLNHINLYTKGKLRNHTY